MLDKPTPAALKEMKRAIKFALDMTNHGLRIEPKGLNDNHLTVVGHSDSDWARDKDSILSMLGFIIFLLGVSIAFRSKQQRSVALSSSEANCVALLEAAASKRDQICMSNFDIHGIESEDTNCCER